MYNTRTDSDPKRRVHALSVVSQLYVFSVFCPGHQAYLMRHMETGTALEYSSAAGCHFQSPLTLTGVSRKCVHRVFRKKHEVAEVFEKNLHQYIINLSSYHQLCASKLAKIHPAVVRFFPSFWALFLRPLIYLSRSITRVFKVEQPPARR